ncbi:MAG: hypothetical protein ACXW1T_08865, partial [Methylophilus sp.]
MSNEQNSNDEAHSCCLSRRDFTVKSVLAAVGVGASSLINPQLLQAANTKSGISYGNGPYPVEGMAAYAPTGNLRRMKFQRRALGPKDVAIKLHYCGVCH